MNSATSTDPTDSPGGSRDAIKPWQFFALAGIACATVGTYLARGRGPESVVLQIVLMITVAGVALAVLYTVRPLFGAGAEEAVRVGGRTRATLERDKVLTLRAIKDLEFDRAMGKMSDADFAEMSGRLRARAGRLIRQLDQSGGYREQIERDLEARLQAAAPGQAKGASVVSAAGAGPVASKITGPTCGSCAVVNDLDARFCKSCGARL